MLARLPSHKLAPQHGSIMEPVTHFRHRDTRQRSNPDRMYGVSMSRPTGSAGSFSFSIDGNRVADDDARKLVVVNEPDGSWTLQVDGQTVAKGSSTVHEDNDPRGLGPVPCRSAAITVR